MAKQPFWLPFVAPTDVACCVRSAWEELTMGGLRVPGEIEIKPQGGIAIKVDRQNAKGTKGNDFVQTGFSFAKFSVVITLFTFDEWEAWQDFLPTVLPTPTKGNVPPLTIYHPALASMGIDKCIVIEVGIPHPGKTPQSVEIEIKCEQWGKVKSAATTKPTDAASKDKALRTIVTQRESEWREKYQKDNNTSLPPEQIPPMPPSFARPGPNG